LIDACQPESVELPFGGFIYTGRKKTKPDVSEDLFTCEGCPLNNPVSQVLKIKKFRKGFLRSWM